MKPSLSQINKPREHLSPQPGTTQRPTWVSALPALRSQASPPSGQLGVLFGALSLFLYHVTKELEISHFVKLPFLPPQSLPCHFPREQRSSMINSPRPSGILAFGCPSHYFWKKKKKPLCIGVQMIYNAVIASGEQRRDSATHIHVSVLPQTPHFSPGCHTTLNRVPCAIQ